MTSDQVNLNNTAVNKKVYKIDWGSCKQHKFETIYNNGINNNMSPCFIKKEEQICQNEVDESPQNLSDENAVPVATPLRRLESNGPRGRLEVCAVQWHAAVPHRPAQPQEVGRFLARQNQRNH
eukprot:CAMPEP_0116954160 /NCGR_PEP_ID=MMETSP0467-20121206/41756_1 /TAXON_ID=283647 /ORGANISM="Mesodinium pulex, Strain SPMC105" /LENGTH=122 /DNA_ID=CAMNT_0004639757 /DNA_START=422 /DNA_END=789 /DNA_ORIENTATION=-